MSQITISNGQISIRFIQYVEGETDVVIERGKFIDSYVLPSKEAKEKCRFHMAEHGFKVVNINGVAVKDGKAVNNEPKVASPKKPKAEKPKVSREEALTAKYGDKEARKAYILEKQRLEGLWRRGVAKNNPELKGKDFHDAVMLGVKNDLAKWEANGRK